jgi:hypothetical protein
MFPWSDEDGEEEVVEGSLADNIYTDEEVISWVKVIMPKTASVSYRTIEKDVGVMASYFTDTGWVKYKKALKRSRLLDAVYASKQNIQAAVIGEIEVEDGKIIDDVYTWLVTVPFSMSYMSGSKKIVDSRMDVKLRLVRFDPPKALAKKHSKAAAKRIGIEQWVGFPLKD